MNHRIVLVVRMTNDEYAIYVYVYILTNLFSVHGKSAVCWTIVYERNL